MKYFIPFLLNGAVALITYFFAEAQSHGLAMVGVLMVMNVMGFLLNLVLGLFYLVRGQRVLGGVYLTMVVGYCLLYYAISESLKGHGKMVNG
ncbi:hypothetical protein [Hymenobacter arizonensis]|nr:hypothetical protein [Hymenobacter arizonensis]